MHFPDMQKCIDGGVSRADGKEIPWRRPATFAVALSHPVNRRAACGLVQLLACCSDSSDVKRCMKGPDPDEFA